MSVLEYRSPTDDAAGRSNIANWLGWAVYLGMSWTWCIGMFLPVLLVRDYGVWAWVVFAVPNVLGAAAMGWVLRDGDSEKLVENHYPAITSFSAVTATFQIFFAWWAFSIVETSKWFAATIALAMCMFLLIRRGDRFRIFLAGAVFVISAMMFVFAITKSVRPIPIVNLPVKAPDLIPLGMVCGFGFLLCPYLDSTFLMSRQRMRKHDARLGFSVGFAFFFFSMIVFSLFYTHINEWLSWFFFLPPNTLWPYAFISVHWLLQLAFTIALHWNVGDAVGKPREARAYWMVLTTLVIGTIIAALVVKLRLLPLISGGEFIYRLFMSFYGLVFPAYVWLCMIPGRGRVAPDRRQWVVLVISCVIASPMYWMGFIERKMIWLLPGLGVVLLARLLIPKRNFATDGAQMDTDGKTDLNPSV